MGGKEEDDIPRATGGTAIGGSCHDLWRVAGCFIKQLRSLGAVHWHQNSFFWLC